MPKNASLVALRNLADSVRLLHEEGWSQSEIECIVDNEIKSIPKSTLPSVQWELLPSRFN